MDWNLKLEAQRGRGGGGGLSGLKRGWALAASLGPWLSPGVRAACPGDALSPWFPSLGFLPGRCGASQGQGLRLGRARPPPTGVNRSERPRNLPRFTPSPEDLGALRAPGTPGSSLKGGMGHPPRPPGCVSAEPGPGELTPHAGPGRAEGQGGPWRWRGGRRRWAWSWDANQE